jgi:hypothetical protein
MRNEYFYLTSDKSKILYEEDFSYGKYKPANKRGEMTYICGQCKIGTFNGKKQVLKLPGESYNGRGILQHGNFESREHMTTQSYW